jgi:uncharacterized protein YndB with AHSA1/START domain
MTTPTLETIPTTQHGGGTAMAVNTLGNERTIAYTDGPELVMERVFDAPRELVWSVLTDPARVTNWWGPRGFTTTVEEMDVRPGGRWRWIGHTIDGQDAPFKGEYLEVVAPERYVRTEMFDVPPYNEDPAGAAIETLTLEDLGDGRTRLVSRGRFPSAEVLDTALATGMIAGALATYDRLAEEIAKG